MLMALGLPLPKRLLVHSHWTVEKKKMSKSVGNVVNPFETMGTYGTDAARYFLARVGGRFKYDVGASFPTTHDNPLFTRSPATAADWTKSQFVKHSAELMSLVGNFYSRITAKKIEQLLCSSPIPTIVELGEAIKDGKQVQGSEILLQLYVLRQRVQGHMQNLVVADALEEIVAVLSLVSLDNTIGSRLCSGFIVVLRFPGQQSLLRDATLALIYQPFTACSNSSHLHRDTPGLWYPPPTVHSCQIRRAPRSPWNQTRGTILGPCRAREWCRRELETRNQAIHRSSIAKGIKVPNSQITKPSPPCSKLIF